MTARTLTAEEQAIENEAIAQFVNQARSATPEQRQQVVAKLTPLAQPETEWGTRPLFQGHKLSVACIQEVIRQVEALDG